MYLRGLDERVALAQAKIDALFSKEPDVDNTDAYVGAQHQGYSDYMNGINDAPILYLEEPVLMSGWKEGRSFAAESEEIRCCGECSDPDIQLCSIHG